MKWLSDDLGDLRELYSKELRVMLSAEEQIVRALPSMVTFATDEELREAFRAHTLDTENHIKRLEQLLEEEKAANPAVTSVGPVKCKGIASMLSETEELLKDTRNTRVRDAGLIAAAQRVEHFEIASYGALRHFARVLGDLRAAELLDQTLQEEGRADHLLTSIAERVNEEANRSAA